MKKTFLPILFVLVGLALTPSAQAVDDGELQISSQFDWGAWLSGIFDSLRQDCADKPEWYQILFRCEVEADWEEVTPGVFIDVSTLKKSFFSKTRYADITLYNTTGETILAGSKLIITANGDKLLNETGFTDAGFPYLETDVDLENTEKLEIRAEFQRKTQLSSLSYDFDIFDPTNGSIALSSDVGGLLVQVPRTLIATVIDPDGVSAAISYQWLANGVEISGATESTYVLSDADVGAVISVSALYVDDSSVQEDLLSETTPAVAARPENSAGELVIVGERLLGSELLASVTDGNDIAVDVAYQWFAGGQALAGETSDSLVLTDAMLGKQLSVEASYTDFDGYDEVLTDTTSHIATVSVSGEAELAAAILAAIDGDWIALASGDYANMAAMDISSAITLTLGQDSDAVISGTSCIELSGDESGLVGLRFDALDLLPDSACGDNNVFISGDNVVLNKNSFLGHVAAPALTSEYNYIYVRGTANLLERNLFAGKDLDIKGAAISVYNKSDGGENGHIIQYNLFKDMPGTSVQSSAYAIQIGRSTSTASLGEGEHIVRYNRFDGVIADRRVIKVQSSRSMIYGNTIVNSTGGIALEDGYENTAANNIIIAAGDNGDDSGISFAPFGHSISGNYISGVSTSSSQRAALLINTETFANTGNATLTVSPVTVANNTVINSNQAIATYRGSKCQDGVFVGYFDSNLIANGVEGFGEEGIDSTAFDNTCTINSLESSFTNEAYYAASSDLGTLAGPAGAAPILVSDSGLAYIDGVGATVSGLHYLEETDVGPGSSLSASTPTTYEGEIDLDFNNWYITFPSGESESDPQWLIDGNISEDEFFYDELGAAVFKTPNIAGVTSDQTKYSRTELREMLRGPEPDPKPADWPSTQGLNKNNWVFSTSYQRLQHASGGVDGVLEATLKVDHVSTSYDEGYEYMVGRVIVGQIHASSDEPLRIYYRKDPNNELGSVYFATEVPGVGDTRYEMIGSSSEDQPNPIDGIALGEIWSYRVDVVGDDLTVTIIRDGKPDVTRTVKTAAAYKNDWMYFKAGVYNQNNGGEVDDYAQATFYSITVTHDDPPAEPGDGSDEGDDGTITEVTDGPSLQAAILAASFGDTIEIGDGDYADIGTIYVTDGVTLTRAEGSTAVITGQLCLYVSGDFVRLTGLEFGNLVLPADPTNECRSNGDGNIVLRGDNIDFDNNVLNGDAVYSILDETENQHNWVVVRGSDITVERNSFSNKAGLIQTSDAQVRGAFVSVYVNGSTTGAVIQYNLFKDLLLADESSAYALAIGRTTGTDSNASGFHTVRYNRFENIDAKTRVIRVQGSDNTISYNTIVNSQGMISLEDGQNNEVSRNIILPTGADGNDGGISIAPYGHSVSGNYIAGVRTTSNERGAIYLNSNANGSGNQALTAAPVDVSNNTVINARQPIHTGVKGCGTAPLIVANFSNNLVASGVDAVSEDYEGVTTSGTAAVRYSCALDASSTFVGEAYYATSLYDAASESIETITFDVSSSFSQEADAELQAAANGFIEASGSISGKGADTSNLIYIEETDVGVGSTTEF